MTAPSHSEPVPTPAAAMPRDLGPLAWVMDELRGSLDEAVATVRDFVADNANARATDLSEVDATPLRMARQRLHQAAGALDMVGLAGAAATLRALEALTQRLVQRPALATAELAEQVTQGARALTDFLDRVMRERLVPDLALFPTYKSWQTQAGAERVHPADLWPEPAVSQPWPPLDLPDGPRYQPSAQVRAHLDKLVLLVVKSLSPQAAAPLALLCAGLCRGTADTATRQFWWASAAYFEAVAKGLLPDDVYVKRAASRILLQYAQLGQASAQGMDLLTRDLLFFAAQAQTEDAALRAACPFLAALQQGFAWAGRAAWDYNRQVLGLIDPADWQRLLGSVAAAQRAWSRWTEGDASAQAGSVAALQEMQARLSLLGDTVSGLRGVWSAVTATLAAGPAERPPAALALEGANSLLFLGAALEEHEPQDSAWAERFGALAQRLQQVLDGQAAPEPTPWMAEVYQRLSERQTLDQVVGQLQAERTELETRLDAFFRQPDSTTLADLPPRLEAMRGVTDLLGLDAASQALLQMRATLAAWAAQPQVPDAGTIAAAAQTLGPNLSALGLLLDTLARQPELAREQFVFDAGSATLRSVLQPAAVAESSIPVVAGSDKTTLEVLPETEASPAAPAPAQPDDAADDEQAELLAIFTDEARQVLQQMPHTLEALRAQPASLPDLTQLRRGFHTLKGSARMVGLADVGEAAWAMEQLLNVWLAEQRPADEPILSLTQQAHAHFSAWVDGLLQGKGEAEAGTSAPVRRCADALRLEGQVLPWETEAVHPDAPVLAEAVKVIGPLCIDLELYNVFLNESDEWSRRLCTELGEWALQPQTRLPDSVLPLAHSLAGASATVGFSALAGLARALEHAVEAVQAREAAGQWLSALEVEHLVQAGEEARHLLHQFAAGFLKEPQADTLQRLTDLAHAQPAPAEPAAAVKVASDVLPESAIDRLDADLFSVFEDESQQLLPRLSAALRQWVGRPDNASARAEVLRILHTFKGSARLAGALRLGDMAHKLESEVLSLPESPASSEPLSPLMKELDTLVARFEELRAGFADSSAGLPMRVEGAQHQTPENLGLPLPLPAVPPRPVSAQPLAANLPTVRVRADLLDRLMTEVGDVMLSSTRLTGDIRQLRQSFLDMNANVARLREQLRDLEMQTESQLQSRLAQSRDTDAKFDPLEFDRYTRVQELTRLLAESVNDVATVQHQFKRAVENVEGNLASQSRQTRDLQRDLLRTRLVPFDSVAERLHRVVRQAAQTLDKAVVLDLQGSDTELDRGVLDRLTPVLEHLLRNAVVHGIEEPAARAQAGKPDEGCITIALQQSGNDLTLTLNDDGAGLDLERLRQKAVASGLADAQAPFTVADASRLIFSAGLSTAESVTELAGRGIGLDAVRNDVLGLGGRIEHFQPVAGGTGFRLVVPLNTAVTQVVMLRVGDFTFGVPAPWVEAVRRAQAPELTDAYRSAQWHEGGQIMPFFWAGALLALSTESMDPQAHEAHSWPVLEFYSAGQRVAWHVDEVLGHQEVVVKPLGPQLGKLPGLVGATVLASGAVALIYNPVALASLYGDDARQWVRRQQAPGASGAAALTASPGSHVPLVLVVDDSITVRRVTQRLLKREGYRVALAADGVQALERLREEAPVVVLCDIEMPRMDGFEFVEHLRADPHWADLPVMMITSRLADKHREHAQSLGVDHYLGKPYDEDELLALVAGYARLAGAGEFVPL
ncbi:MAG TPA: Hpt domain-containing protein [Macromonas sp.]|nr:Hpt domain-containing protein [Macromonas sp.]